MIFSTEVLEEVLRRHDLWLKGNKDGERANLSGVSLRGAGLSGANLECAVLDGADLDGADLSGADLRSAFAPRASLIGANLVHAILVDTDLREANLRDADLSDANIAGVYLSGADLRGTKLPRNDVPVVAGLDAAILAQITARPDLFTMDAWNYPTACGTAHCRAGWAIALAGEAGRRLVADIGSCATAALIYTVSRPTMPVPDFHASAKNALADLRECAAA